MQTGIQALQTRAQQHSANPNPNPARLSARLSLTVRVCPVCGSHCERLSLYEGLLEKLTALYIPRLRAVRAELNNKGVRYLRLAGLALINQKESNLYHRMSSLQSAHESQLYRHSTACSVANTEPQSVFIASWYTQPGMATVRPLS